MKSWLAIPLLFASCASLTDTTEREGIQISSGTWLENRERPWVIDQWGLTRGNGVLVRVEGIPEGGTRVQNDVPKGFTGARLILDLRPDRVDATVVHWSDEGSDRTWIAPSGSVVVCPDGRSRPRILGFDLHDAAAREGTHSCIHGIVDVTGG